MKKINILVLAFIVALSCAKEPVVSNNDVVVNGEVHTMTFTVSCITRAVLNSDRSVSFSAGDKIAVFANGNKYQLTTEAGGSVATFTGSCEEASTYYAVYPYADGISWDEGVIKGVEIATSSRGTSPGTFHKDNAVFACASSNKSLAFKQICALLKLTVPDGITDLKEVIVWPNEQSGTNVITGTFDITIASAGATPSISTTTAKYQTGLTKRSDPGITPGVYYIPVLPANLTKGINLKMTFGSSPVTGRAFNGSAMTLEAGQVYDMGVVRHTNEFVLASFESNTITDEIRDADGNLAKISVVSNAFSTANNSSSYILKDDHSSNSGATSGLIKFDLTSSIGKIKFPYGVRDKYDKVQVNVYLGSNKYYPRFDFNYSNAQLPSRINGVAVDSQKTWDETVRTNDWNALEWDASAFGKTHFFSLDKFGLRMFLNYEGSNMAKGDDSDHVAFVDDIKFILK